MANQAGSLMSARIESTMTAAPSPSRTSARDVAAVRLRSPTHGPSRTAARNMSAMRRRMRQGSGG